jgi:hypothetical protein
VQCKMHLHSALHRVLCEKKSAPCTDGVFCTVVALQCIVHCALKFAHRKHRTAYPAQKYLQSVYLGLMMVAMQLKYITEQ